MNLKNRLKELGITQRELKEYINSKGITIGKNTILEYVRNTDRGFPRTAEIIETALKELAERKDKEYEEI